MMLCKGDVSMPPIVSAQVFVMVVKRQGAFGLIDHQKFASIAGFHCFTFLKISDIVYALHETFSEYLN